MAEPGDPTAPDDDHDDLIGFASPASLRGAARNPPPSDTAPGPPPIPEPTPEQQSEPEPDLFSARADPVEHTGPEPAPPAETRLAEVLPAEVPPAEVPVSAEPTPTVAPGIFETSPEFSTRGRRREPAAIPGGGMGLYAVYALILFAVPTMGVSAIIALLAVTGRPGPDDDVSRSHFIYQQRTLWAATVAVVIGAILILAPFALTPAILFLAALWLIVRGAAGVWALKAGQPIARPRGWWI